MFENLRGKLAASARNRLRAQHEAELRRPGKFLNRAWVDRWKQSADVLAGIGDPASIPVLIEAALVDFPDRDRPHLDRLHLDGILDAILVIAPGGGRATEFLVTFIETRLPELEHEFFRLRRAIQVLGVLGSRLGAQESDDLARTVIAELELVESLEFPYLPHSKLERNREVQRDLIHSLGTTGGAVSLQYLQIQIVDGKHTDAAKDALRELAEVDNLPALLAAYEDKNSKLAATWIQTSEGTADATNRTVVQTMQRILERDASRLSMEDLWKLSSLKDRTKQEVAAIHRDMGTDEVSDIDYRTVTTVSCAAVRQLASAEVRRRAG
jgi:hypothetical protein